MIEVTIPGKQNLILGHLVCDVNGTLALDGSLIPGIAEKSLPCVRNWMST